VPLLNISGNSVIGLPLVMALVSYVLFIYAGVRKHPGGFFKASLFPSGVPWPLYIIVTPIEFISTFILRPVTLTLRLLMNMVAGHMLLVLCFSATQFFFFTVLADGNLIGLLGVGSLAFGIAFTLFEILVAALQAYVFTFLAAVYIQLALADEH
jgi:F-type H+-transporting ATPase subunit a